MSRALVFSVPGTPRPQPRPRFVGGRVVSTASRGAKLWRLAVERAVRLAVLNSGRAKPLFDGAVRIGMVFTFQPPASQGRRVDTPHIHKPDGDNLAKLVMDVMEAEGVFKNDSQAGHLEPVKWWGRTPGVAVIVEDCSEVRRAPTSAASAPPDWLRAGSDGMSV